MLRADVHPAFRVLTQRSHLFDHFRLALEGLDEASVDKAEPISVNYDTRTRNIASETDVAAAREAFEGLRCKLSRATAKGTAVDGKRAVRLKALTPECVEVQSSWDREVSACAWWSTGRVGSADARYARHFARRLRTPTALVLRPTCQYVGPLRPSLLTLSKCEPLLILYSLAAHHLALLRVSSRSPPSQHAPRPELTASEFSPRR